MKGGLLMKLSPEQEEKLEAVRKADRQWRMAKEQARAMVQFRIEEMVSAQEYDRRKAVMKALELGVPKSRINRDGLHTTSPEAIAKIIEKEERLKP